MHDMASVFYLKIFDTFCSILWLPESIRVKQFFEERITASRDNGLSQWRKWFCVENPYTEQVVTKLDPFFKDGVIPLPLLL